MWFGSKFGSRFGRILCDLVVLVALIGRIMLCDLVEDLVE